MVTSCDTKQLLVGYVERTAKTQRLASPAKALTCSRRLPLHVAAAGGHAGCIEALAGLQGLKTELRDCNGDTALHVAVRNGRTAVVRVLAQTTGVDVRERNSQGNDALQMAREKAFEMGSQDIEARRAGDELVGVVRAACIK